MKTNNVTEKQIFDRARSNLLLMIVLTLINIVLFLVGSQTMMLFSATVPYLLIMVGVINEIDVILNVCIIITAVIMILYFLCWILSKRNPVWMIVAATLFIIDTIILIYIYIGMQEFSGILDFLMHIWVLYYLFIGIKYGYKLKKMSPEATTDKIPEKDFADTKPLYIADMTNKYRVLAESNIPGYNVSYRRIKKINELVINNYVYDSIELLVEPPHTLSSRLNGHLFEAGYNGSHSFIRIDGELITKKFRIW